MKPLETGRRALTWMGIQFADDDPDGGQQKFAKRVFSVTFRIIFIGISSQHVITFLTLQPVDAEEFFFILLQFVMAVYGITSFITIYSCDSLIPIVFQSLTEIYKKCEQQLSVQTKNTKKF